MEIEPFESESAFTEFTEKKKRPRLKIPKRIQTEDLVKCVIIGICVISILFVMISFIMKSFEVSSLQKQFLTIKDRYTKQKGEHDSLVTEENEQTNLSKKSQDDIDSIQVKIKELNSEYQGMDSLSEGLEYSLEDAYIRYTNYLKDLESIKINYQNKKDLIKSLNEDILQNENNIPKLKEKITSLEKTYKEMNK